MNRRLLDAKTIHEEYGIPKETAYTMMRKVGVIDLTQDGIRKLYVRQDEFDAYLERMRVRAS